jgi:hypothetical protein
LCQNKLKIADAKGLEWKSQSEASASCIDQENENSGGSGGLDSNQRRPGYGPDADKMVMNGGPQMRLQKAP